MQNQRNKEAVKERKKREENEEQQMCSKSGDKAKIYMKSN